MLGRDLAPVKISDMFAAERRLRKIFPPSPMICVESLNQQLGAPVYLKAESLLPSGAYKYRGAVNKITSLVEEHGNNIRIITASSGNHGMARAGRAEPRREGFCCGPRPDTADQERLHPGPGR